MFRNGITAGHRHLRQSISAITPATTRCPNASGSSTAFSARHDAPFVCRSCKIQTRFMSKGTHSRRKIMSDKSMEHLKNLESHVQAMERAYIDAVRKKAETARLPQGEITEEMKDRAYAALMAPPEDPVNVLKLPGPRSLAQRLPKEIVGRLGASTELITAERPQWEPVLAVIERKGGFGGMTVGAVNSMMRYMDSVQRAQLVPRVWNMMAAAEIEPDSLTYDLAMMAYTQLDHTAEAVEALFGEMIQRGVSPTKYSYAHLLKAYSQKGDLVSSAQAFKDMQAANIEPDLVVYTTLIQTALKCHEYTVSWEIFNLIKLKSLATHPDEATYNLMIHACAETGETERALNLWNEMTLRKGIEPNAVTYTSIIHACALRKDYYHEAWKFATEMVRRGMALDVYSVNILIQACGRVGELTRARLLVRHMVNSGIESLQPNQITFQNLLRAYATYKVPTSRNKNKLLDNKSREEINPLDAVFVQPENKLERKIPGVEEPLGVQSFMNEIPFLPKAVLMSRRDVLDEAALVVNWLRDYYPEMVDTQMMNSYLDVCSAQGSIGDMKWSYFNDLENPPTYDEIKAKERAEQEARHSQWPSQRFDLEDDTPLYRDPEPTDSAASEPAVWTIPEDNTTEIPTSTEKTAASEQLAATNEPASTEEHVSTEQSASELPEFDSSTSKLPDPESEPSSPESPEQSTQDPSDPSSDISASSSTQSTSESEPSSFSSDDDASPGSNPTLLPPEQDSESADFDFSDLPKLPRNLYTYDSCLSACVIYRNLRFARKVWADRMKYIETPDYRAIRDSERKRLDFAAEKKLIDVLALDDKTIEARERMLTLQKEAGVEWQWEDLRTLYVKAVQLEDAVTVRAVKDATQRDAEGRRKWPDVTEEEAETPGYRY